MLSKSHNTTGMQAIVDFELRDKVQNFRLSVKWSGREMELRLAKNSKTEHPPKWVRKTAPPGLEVSNGCIDIP